MPPRPRHHRSGEAATGVGGADRTSRLGRWTAALSSLLLTLTLVGAAPPTVAEAAVQAPFNSVFSTDDNGAISIVGNAQMTCRAVLSGCTAARDGGGTDVNNNNYGMEFLDVDGVVATTNSTTAQVDLPAGSTVLYARLLWSGRFDAGSGGTAGSVSAAGGAKLRSPIQSGYSTVTATTLVKPDIPSHPYQASLEVTSTVRDGGNGTYAFADMVGATGTDVYAGWSLVIAYQNPTLPLRNLTVFEGFADVSTTAGNSPVTTTVSGFLTPATGAVRATVGVTAWEGDLGSTGDVLKLNTTTLSDAARPANNFFDSSISNLGVSNAARNPSYSNNFGVDMGRVNANGVLANGATSADVSVSTTGETVYLGLVTTEIELYVPSFAGISKSVTNLSGHSPAEVGDTLQYRLTFTNSGQDTATAVQVRDSLPANVTIVPASIRVVTGANASTTPKTDASGDDVAEYVTASRLVRVRLGTGANQTTGGTVGPGAGSDVTFRVTVDPAAAGTSIDNGGSLDYRAQTLGRNYTFTTNTVSTPVQTLADLAITQTSSPTTQTAGSQVSYSLVVTNLGPSTATSVVTTNTLPAGVSLFTVTYPSASTCSSAGRVVTCTTPTLASGASFNIIVRGTIDAATAAGTVDNTATVSSSISDNQTSNNTATASTTVTRSADLRLSKTGSTAVAAGAPASYTLTVTNDGPSSAGNVSVTDTLPGGVTLVSTAPSQGSCAATGQTITCTLGTLAPAGSATVVINATVGASVTDTSVTNTASVTSGTPDGAGANNTASAVTTVSQNADIVVTKTASPTTVTAGNVLTYTVSVANLAGRSDARGVVLTDALPAGLTLIQATPTQGACSTTSPVSCNLGLITPGSSVGITIATRVDSTRNPGTLSNTASATTTTAQSVTGNDSSSVDVNVNTRADLSLTKTASPNPVQLGTELGYTLTATNNGPSQARGVTITDTLPAEVTFVAASSGCTRVNRTLTCVVGTLEVNDSAVRTITVTTPQTAPEGPLTNAATVAASTTDPSAADNTASFTSSTQASADLVMVKTTSPNTVVPGRDVTYTLTASNQGPSTAQGVRVSDTLPSGVTYRSASIAGGGSCSRVGQDISCPLGSLAGGSSRVVTVVGAVDPDLTSSSTSNTGVVSATSPTDPTTSNNTDTSLTPISRSADLGVSLTTTTPTVRAGEEADFELVVTNAGPSTARGGIATVQLPEGVELVAESLDPGCTITGRTLSCELDTLPVDGRETRTFRARVLPGNPAGPISASATVGATTPDADGSGNADAVELVVVTEADLAAGVTVTPADLVAGSPATYVLTATNLGPSDATTVTLTDTLPAGLSISGVDPGAGTCTVAGRQISCTVDRVVSGGVLTVRVVVAVEPGATGSRTNSVVVGSDVTDPVAGNDTDSVTSAIVGSADLRLAKTVSPERAIAGATVRYTLSVVNAGPSSASAVVLDDTLPNGVQLVAGGVDAPTGVTCTEDLSANRVTCDLGDLAPTASRVVTVEALVASTAASGSTITNSAAVSSPTPSQNPDARTDSVSNSVGTSADLGVTKSARSESPDAGATETYLITVTNHGPSVARAAQIVDTLPEGLSYTSSDGSCTADGSEVTCTLGDLDPGEVVVVEITADIDPAAAGQVVENTVTVTSDTDDPVSGDDTATLEQPISAQNDLELTKQVTSGAVVAGQPVTYRISLTNRGPSQARDAQVTDVLPELLGFVAATASDGGTCGYDERVATPADDDQVSCRWDVLEVGETFEATVTMRVPADYPDDRPIANTANATSSATDPTPASATVDSPVTGRADLSLTKTLLSGTPTAGQEVRWQLVVRNDGPSVARAVRVDDPAPSGVSFTGAETAQGQCPVTAQAVACDLGEVEVGATRTVTVDATLAADFDAAELSNAATVTSPTSDPDPADNTGSTTSPARASADLAISNTAAPATLTAGELVTWSIRVVNDGPSDARGVQVSDELPAGVTLVSRTLDGPGTCPSGGGACIIDTLAAGSARVLTVVARLDPAFSGSTLVNTASVSSSVADPDLLDNTATATTGVGRAADLSVSQTGTTLVAAGGTISWQITVANAGPSDADGVVLVDTLPEGLLGVTGTFPGGTCSLDGRALTCPGGVVGANGSLVVTVSATLDPAVTAASLTNAVTVSAGTVDPDSDDLSSELTTTVFRSADLSVTKTPATPAFTAGESVGWVITVRNAGPSVGRTVTVEDTIPDGVTGLVVDSEGARCVLNGALLSCSVDDVLPGIPARIQLSGALAPGYADPTLVNTATVRTGTPDPETDNDTASSETAVVTSADLSVGKSLTSGTPVAGAPIAYRLTVHNAGPSDARDVVVTDSLPAVLEDLTVSTDTGTCSYVGHDLTCRLTTLPDAGTAVIELAGTVGAAYTGELSNTAGVRSATPDPELQDNLGTSSSSVDGAADLALSKVGPATVVAGERATWTLEVTNRGPSNARDVVLADVLPAGLSAIRSVTSAGTCTGALTCRLGDVLPNQPVQISVSALVAPDDDEATLVNTASVSSDTADPSSTDNNARSSTAVTPVADLVVSKVSDPTRLVPGTDATYAVTVRNAGASTARLVSVTDELPDGLSLRAAGPTTDGDRCEVVGRTITCEVDALGPEADLRVSIPVSVASGYAGTELANSARANTTTPDADPADDAVTTTSPVVGQADLTLHKTAPASVTAGTPLSWLVELRNEGPSDAQDVVVTDTLPTGIGVVDATPSQGTCTQTGRVVTCALGVVGPGGLVSVTLSTRGGLDPSYATGDIVNTAQVSSPTVDPDTVDPSTPDGRAATATTRVVASADVTVSKVADQTSAVAGGPVSWTITVSNTGPATARGVALRDDGVPGLTGFTLTPPDGVSCDAGVCPIGTLRPGAENALVFIARGTVPADSVAESVVNTATASAGTDDPDPGDNRSTAPILLTRSAGVSITKTGPSTVVPGRPVSWTLTATNAGPSLARGVLVTDPVPAAVTDLQVVAPQGVDCTGGHALRCTVGGLPAGAGRAVSITVSGTLAADATGPQLVNTALVSASTPDPQEGDDTSTAAAQVTARADLSLTKTGPGSVTAGEEISWRLEVANEGPSQARTVLVSDALPAGVGQIAAGSTEDGVDCTVVGAEVRCTIAVLNPGSERTVVVSGVVAASYLGATLANSARTSSDVADLDPGDNVTEAVRSMVQRSADVSITKAVTPNPIVAGEPATFTLRVASSGPSTARRVLVTDLVPTGMAIGAVTTTAGTCAVEDRLVRCNLGELAPTGDDPVVIVIPVAVDGDVSPNGFVNTAFVTTADPDPDTADNSAQVSGDTTARADLSMTKRADREGAVPGEPIGWTLTVRNAGPATARDVTVLDDLPSEVTDVEVTSSVGVCERGGIVSCALGDLGNGRTETVTITGRVSPDIRAAAIVNSGLVAAGTPDPELADDQDQEVTPVAGSADLTLAKTTDTADLVAGGPVQWTLTAGNAGPSTAYDVVLTDLLPAAPTGPLPAGCTAQERTVRCVIDTLGVGQTETRVITATIDPDQAGPLGNSASISSAAPDPDPVDNTAVTPPAPVGRVADLEVSKSVDAGEHGIGDQVVYRVRVGSTGPSDATGVEVQERWPAGVRFVAADPSAGTFDPQTMVWSVGLLSPGQSEELVLVGTVTGRDGLRNQVSVRAAGVLDPDPNDDTAAASVILDPDDGSQPGAGQGRTGPLPNTGGPTIGLLVLGVLGLGGGVGLLAVRPRRRLPLPARPRQGRR